MSAARTPRNHVFIIDGTLSRIDEDACLTHAGRLDLLLRSAPTPAQTVGYHRGVQGAGMSKWIDAAIGRGFNASVIAGYSALASRVAPGDRVFLFGFSRGAYAVRSIAGMIDRIGLLRPEAAIERRVKRAFEYYARETLPPQAAAFRAEHCHERVEIACIGVWDTVKALGLPYPLLSRFFPMATEFHDHRLGASVRAAYQALAADEDRTAYDPVPWERGDWTGALEQAWFPGAHGDIGGERGCLAAPIPLTNLGFRWLMDRAEGRGLMLPEGWREGFPVDAGAPMVGARTGMNRLFLMRRPREARLGADGQVAHPSLAERMRRVPGYAPRARGLGAEEAPAGSVAGEGGYSV